MRSTRTARSASSTISTTWGSRRFVFTSTCSNYGIHESSRLATEESELNPQSLYAHTKIAVEQYVLDRASELACATTVLRIATAYGLSPRMRFDLTVSQFAWELATGRPLQVYDADTWRPYCHVRDICKAIMTVLTSRGERRPRRGLQRGRHLSAVHQADDRRRGPPARGGTSVTYREGVRPAQLPRVIRQDRRRLDFRCDHTVQDYLARLTAAVQAGIFPDPRRDLFGNFTVRHIEPVR